LDIGYWILFEICFLYFVFFHASLIPHRASESGIRHPVSGIRHPVSGIGHPGSLFKVINTTL